MLNQIIQAHGGTLPSDVLVTFANTGREMPQTLDFVRDCGDRFAPVHWLEYGRGEVTYETASRHGEPFNALIDKKQYLPNPVTRFCTSELKIRVMRDFARAQGWDNWTNILGLRADEPHRVARAKTNRDQWDNAMPLAEAGITKADVAAFWASKNWGLQLPTVKGKTPLGNCDLCFLKSYATIYGIMRDRPELANWWIEAEAEAKTRASKPLGAVFRKDRPSYAAILDMTRRQGDMIDPQHDDAATDCFCNGDT